MRRHSFSHHQLITSTLLDSFMGLTTLLPRNDPGNKPVFFLGSFCSKTNKKNLRSYFGNAAIQIFHFGLFFLSSKYLKDKLPSYILPLNSKHLKYRSFGFTHVPEMSKCKIFSEIRILMLLLQKQRSQDMTQNIFLHQSKKLMPKMFKDLKGKAYNNSASNILTAQQSLKSADKETTRKRIPKTTKTKV